MQKWKSCFCVTSHNQVTTIMKSQLNFDMNTMISRDIFKFLILLETWKSRKYFVKSNGRQEVKNRRVFLLHQLWIVNYSVKSSSNNLSNENINTGVSVVFKTKRELKCQNELFLKYHFSGNTSLYVFIAEIIWQTFDPIIDDP